MTVLHMGHAAFVALSGRLALAEPEERRSGAFMVLVGPDGVGKTTIARAIIDRHEGPTAYFHFLPTLQGVMAERPPIVDAAMPPKTTPFGSRPLGWFRLLRNAVRCWLTYLRHIQPALQRGCLVVGDRWLYGYLVQPHALKFYGPHSLASAILRLLPQPDMVVNLSAPPPVVRSRKQELSEQHIEVELRRWATLPSDHLHTFDAASAPDDVARRVLEALASLHSPGPIGARVVGERP